MTLSIGPTTIQAVGECMLEIVRTRGDGVLLGYGGDAYNTSVYLRRVADQLGSPVRTGFLTGLGADEESRLMRTAWLREGVEDLSVPVPEGAPGAYLVTTDAAGERSFAYWRAGSAAARLLQGLDWLDRVAGDYVYLSGVTLQLTSDESREALVERLHALRAAGTVVAFDSNYRPSGWRSAAAARAAMTAVLRECDIALVTLEDETALGNADDVPSCGTRLAALGVRECVVKDGPRGAWVFGEESAHVPTEERGAVDTTGAGDSFNGAYLAARIAGLATGEAALLGHRVAGHVVTQPGAVVDVATMPVLV